MLANDAPEKSCDCCGRPESEQTIEPVVLACGDPAMLCEDCRGVPADPEDLEQTRTIAQEVLDEFLADSGSRRQPPGVDTSSDEEPE